MTDQYGYEQVLDEDGNLLWIGARAKTSPRRFFVYVPNTGSWHRYPELEAGPGYVEGVVFKEMSAKNVLKRIPELKRIDERSLGWVVEEFRNQNKNEVRSTSDLGLPAGKGSKRPSIEVVQDLKLGQWITVKTYEPARRHAAISLASDIRRGKRKRLMSGVTGMTIKAKRDGAEKIIVESRVQPVKQGYNVEIRPTLAAKKPED
ncbi:hypothetical protein [Pseudarthrobacter sp. Y6]|uniref:hypothetical protein n=1 Tax=Pseudarthrobacter sp. Y6 TaxID=3418422 RepID=UPI003CF8E4FB